MRRRLSMIVGSGGVVSAVPGSLTFGSSGASARPVRSFRFQVPSGAAGVTGSCANASIGSNNPQTILIRSIATPCSLRAVSMAVVGGRRGRKDYCARDRRFPQLKLESDLIARLESCTLTQWAGWRLSHCVRLDSERRARHGESAQDELVEQYAGQQVAPRTNQYLVHGAHGCWMTLNAIMMITVW